MTRHKYRIDNEGWYDAPASASISPADYQIKPGDVAHARELQRVLALRIAGMSASERSDHLHAQRAESDGLEATIQLISRVAGPALFVLASAGLIAAAIS